MATLKVEVSGLRSASGHLLAALYTDKREWLKGKTAKTFKDATGAPTGSSGVCVFEDVPPGTYAVAVYHDENDNQEMDTNFFGVPKEGFAFSNVERLAFGAPSFEAAAFRLEEADLTVPAKMFYLL